MAYILVADDDPVFAEFVRRTLADRGDHITLVADGAEALRALATARYDLLIADIQMPVVDGIALALKASAGDPALKIVLVTGYAHQRQRAHGLSDLMEEVLSKPLTREEMAAAVERALGRPRSGPRPS